MESMSLLTVIAKSRPTPGFVSGARSLSDSTMTSVSFAFVGESSSKGMAWEALRGRGWEEGKARLARAPAA
jgi:hypothetical protein